MNDHILPLVVLLVIIVIFVVRQKKRRKKMVERELAWTLNPINPDSVNFNQAVYDRNFPKAWIFSPLNPESSLFDQTLFDSFSGQIDDLLARNT